MKIRPCEIVKAYITQRHHRLCWRKFVHASMIFLEGMCKGPSTKCSILKLMKDTKHRHVQKLVSRQQ